MNNYPPGVTELPDDDLVEKEYVFEVHGEVTVKAHSEEGAEDLLEEDLREVLADGVRSGEIEIR